MQSTNEIKQVMNEPQPNSPRRTLQALLAIPERERTDAQWDEINELEILLAPGNRESGPNDQGNRRNSQPQGGQRPGGPPGNKPSKGFHNRNRGKGR